MITITMMTMNTTTNRLLDLQQGQQGLHRQLDQQGLPRDHLDRHRLRNPSLKKTPLGWRIIGSMTMALNGLKMKTAPGGTVNQTKPNGQSGQSEHSL